MTIKEAWNVIATLDIELVEQYSVRECDRWHEAIQKLQDFLQPMLVEPKKEVATTEQPKERQRRKNPMTQFELKSIGSDELIKEAYEWCKVNLPLKDNRSLHYWVDELYIITSSQRILDKINKHFGSNFSFGINGEKRYFF